MTKSTALLVLWILIPLCAIIVSQTPSEAYIPMLFPAVILSVSLLIYYVYKQQAVIAVFALVFIAITNSYLLISKNYLNSFPFSKRISIAQEIIKDSKGREYNLVGKGEGSQHKSFTLNYEYLTWWIGHPPSKKPVDVKIIIKE